MQNESCVSVKGFAMILVLVQRRWKDQHDVAVIRSPEKILADKATSCGLPRINAALQPSLRHERNLENMPWKKMC